MSMGGHQSAAAGSTTWLTPRHVLDALGGWEEFDLDPCAAPAPRPWPTAWIMNSEADADGLALDWFGRVFLNPPYGDAVEAWMRKLADHGRGTALIFARTETDPFRRQVWERASARFVLVAGLDQSWSEAMREFLARQSGPVSVSDAYRYFARSPKARGRHWQAKVRQKLQQCGNRLGRNEYVAA